MKLNENIIPICDEKSIWWQKRKWKITWLQIFTKKGKGKTCESKYKMKKNLILMCNWEANVHIMV